MRVRAVARDGHDAGRFDWQQDMSSLDEPVLAELRQISRLGFHARWESYWPLVFTAIETAPRKVAALRDAIIEFEDYTAQQENRPTLKQFLGDQRRVWQEEVEAVFLEFIDPFIDSDGSPEEREALYQELQQVKADIRTKIEQTERGKAYAEYALALDYAAAFASVACLAFGKQRPAPAKAVTEKRKPPPPAQPTLDVAATGEPTPRRADGQETDEKPARRRRIRPLVTVLLLLVVLLGAGAGVLAVLKPELISVDMIKERVTSLFGPSEIDVEPFLAASGSSCDEPGEVTTWSEVTAFADCLDAAAVERETAFRALVDQAGGIWNDNASNGDIPWSGVEQPNAGHLQRAWTHLQDETGALRSGATGAVLAFEGSHYPPDEERDAIGWRFAVWLCECNARAEKVEDDDPKKAFRVFVSTPELVTTPQTYGNLVTNLRNYFLSGEKLGEPNAVAATVENADLPHGFTSGPRLAGPFGSKGETQDAIDRITEVYDSSGFDVHPFSLR